MKELTQWSPHSTVTQLFQAISHHSDRGMNSARFLPVSALMIFERQLL